MFNDRVREARKRAALTQEQLAARIGVAKSTVAGYEKGSSEPDMAKMQKIMSALNVDANYLLQDEMRAATEKLAILWHTPLTEAYVASPELTQRGVCKLLDIAYVRPYKAPFVIATKGRNAAPSASQVRQVSQTVDDYGYLTEAANDDHVPSEIAEQESHDILHEAHTRYGKKPVREE